MLFHVLWQVTSSLMQVYWSPVQEEPMRLRQVWAEQEATITARAKIHQRALAIASSLTTRENSSSTESYMHKTKLKSRCKPGVVLY